MAKESWYLNESEADDHQVELIRKNIKTSFAVAGSAGSGKTLLALWKAVELAESGEEDYLIIVFTRALKQFILDGLNTINHHYNLNEDNIMYYWEWANRRDKPSADYIIVDEVQDFDESELTDLINASKKHLLLFGDTAQQIYAGLPNKGRLMNMEEISYKANVNLHRLYKNHRLPKKVARVAQLIGDQANDIELENICLKEGIDKPRVIKCTSLEQQLDYIQGVVSANGFGDVGILFPTNRDVKKAYDYYVNKGWDVEKRAGYGAGSMNLNFSSTNPKLITYHSAKGLQFEAVFLPNFSIENSNPAYVAITRTYRDLFILHSDVNSSLYGIVPNSLLEFIDGTGYNGDFKNTKHNSTKPDLGNSFDDIPDDLPF